MDIAEVAREAHQANPALFSQTEAQSGWRQTEAESSIPERIRETVSALHFRVEARLFRSRLKLLTGVRHEHTKGDFMGALSDPNAVFVRNPNGTIAKDAAGNRFGGWKARSDQWRSCS